VPLSQSFEIIEKAGVQYSDSFEYPYYGDNHKNAYDNRLEWFLDRDSGPSDNPSHETENGKKHKK
jgi:hypothetical protein